MGRPVPHGRRRLGLTTARRRRGLSGPARSRDRPVAEAHRAGLPRSGLARALRAPSWDGTWHAAYLDYAEALAARLDGQPALEEWAAGVERANRFGAYVALLPRLELAAEHLRAGDRATGKEQLVGSGRTRGRWAGWYERRAAALATRNRVPLPVEEEAAGPLHRLTAREREVLALLTDGATDREIAAALVISPRTASIHVGNILAKLDVPNRGAAAALARDLG